MPVRPPVMTELRCCEMDANGINLTENQHALSKYRTLIDPLKDRRREAQSSSGVSELIFVSLPSSDTGR